MFDYRVVRESIDAGLTDCRYWRDRAMERLASPDDERREYWTRAAHAWNLAQIVLDRATDRHFGISCPPEADCDHEEPDLATVLKRLPALADIYAMEVSTDRNVPERALSTLLGVIGAQVEDQLHALIHSR